MAFKDTILSLQHEKTSLCIHFIQFFHFQFFLFLNYLFQLTCKNSIQSFFLTDSQEKNVTVPYITCLNEIVGAQSRNKLEQFYLTKCSEFWWRHGIEGKTFRDNNKCFNKYNIYYVAILFHYYLTSKKG